MLVTPPPCSRTAKSWSPEDREAIATPWHRPNSTNPEQSQAAEQTPEATSLRRVHLPATRRDSHLWDAAQATRGTTCSSRQQAKGRVSVIPSVRRPRSAHTHVSAKAFRLHHLPWLHWVWRLLWRVCCQVEGKNENCQLPDGHGLTVTGRVLSLTTGSRQGDLPVPAC